MAKEPGSSIDDRAEGGFLDGFLTGIERVGNKVPHPGIIFFILIGIVIVLSVILSWTGWSATYEAIDPVTHEVVTQTTTVRSLLSADGIRFLFSSIVPNFMNFGAVGVIIVAMVGVGVAEESGLIATLVRKIVEIAPKFMKFGTIEEKRKAMPSAERRLRTVVVWVATSWVTGSIAS